MVNIRFNLRNPDSTQATPINLIVRFSGCKIVCSTGEKILPKHWQTNKDSKNYQRATHFRDFPEYLELNARLDAIDAFVKDVYRKFRNDNERLPSEFELKKLIEDTINKPAKPTKLDFFAFVEQFIEELGKRNNNRTGRIFSRSTILAHKNTLRLIKSFRDKKRFHIDFETIDLNFYYDFKDYLTDEEKFSLNTIGKHIKTIKTWLNDATERNLNQNKAYKSNRFALVGENAESIYLNRDEINAIYELDLSHNKRLEKVRDLFIVGCWTGLRFSDFTRIKPQNIVDGFIHIETKKTGEKVVIPIHWMVSEIMKKYEGLYSNCLPPELSNAKMNKYLKEIGKLIDILDEDIYQTYTKGGIQQTARYKKHEKLVTHSARRSFATNLYLSGVPTLTISKITGHRTEKSFMTYIKITPKENAEVLKMHWEKEASLKAM